MVVAERQHHVGIANRNFDYVRLEDAELAGGRERQFGLDRDDLVQFPFRQLGGGPGLTNGDVQLALVSQHLAEDLGVPAGTGEQFDHRHVRFQAEESQRLTRLAFVGIACTFFGSADVAGQRFLDRQRRFIFGGRRRCLRRDGQGQRQREQGRIHQGFYRAKCHV